MARRHYSDADRAAALAVYDANAGNLTRTAREAGVPASTLERWVKGRDMAAPPDLRTQKAETLADALEDLAWQMIGAARFTLAEFKGVTIPWPELVKMFTGLGIVIDKLQVLRGKPTDIQEVRDWRRELAEEGIDPYDVVAEAERIVAGAETGG